MSSGSLTPAIIASWPAPNYVDPITRGAYLQASVIVLQIVVAAVVAARLYARFFMLKSPGLDDFLLIFAMVATAFGNRVPAWLTPLTNANSYRIRP